MQSMTKGKKICRKVLTHVHLESRPLHCFWLSSLPNIPSNLKPRRPLDSRRTRKSTSSNECFLFVDTQRCLSLLNASEWCVAKPT